MLTPKSTALFGLFLFVQGVALVYSFQSTKLVADLLKNYDPYVLPTVENKPVNVNISMYLINILSAHEGTNTAEIVAWVSHTWQDSSMSWNPEDYSGTQSIRVPADSVWTPDISSYNYVTTPAKMDPDLVVVYSDGTMLYIPNFRMSVMCDVTDVESRNGATCHLKYGSWTHDGAFIELGIAEHDLTSDYDPTSRFEILESNAEKHSIKYDCCPEVYEDVTFTLRFREKRGGWRKHLDRFDFDW